MRCAIYARLSRRTDTNVANIDSQLARCRELATARGWTVVAEHVDLGESAYDRDDIEDRPAFADLLAGIRNRHYDVILGWRPDRLWRDPIECAVVLRLCARLGVTNVATVTEGDRDPHNPGDEMVATIVAAVGRYESAAKSARLRAKARQQVEAGHHVGGKVAYGYRDAARRHIDETEAATIRMIAERIRAGDSIYSIVATLNDAGITRKRGGTWTSHTVTRMIRRPYLAGLNMHRGQIVGKGNWEPILEVDDWVATCDALEANHRRPHRIANRPYLLTTGIARCGVCGERMMAQPRDDRRRAYRCCPPQHGGEGCGRVRILAEDFEDDVVERLFAAIGSGELVDPVPPPVGVTVAEVNAAEAKLTSLARDHYVLGVIGRDEYLAARAPLAAEAERLRSALLSQPSRALPTLAGLAAGWAMADTAERRELLRPVVAAVRVGPGVRGRNFYDPDRVEIDYADAYKAD